MKYLLIGIWHGNAPEVQTHRSEIPLVGHDAHHASMAVTKHAKRVDIPNQILSIEVVNGGPKVVHDWARDIDFLQSMFDEDSSPSKSSAIGGGA